MAATLPYLATILSTTDFSSLALSPALLENLKTLEYHHMTPIQADSLPHILCGTDVIGQAKTGSGKTAAFGLGLLQKLEVKRFAIQSLILCPTRELADQVAKELRKLARTIHNIKILSLCGGASFGYQAASLEHGAHIVVGTPGRIEEHLRKGKLTLDQLNTFVLDEADRMLDMGFQDAIEAICAHLPQHRQTLLFSATFPKEIEGVASKILNAPVRVSSAETTHNTDIEQHFYAIDGHTRQQALTHLLCLNQPESCVVFCNTKRETESIADALKSSGIAALALHGDLEQKKRDQILVCFSNKSAAVLVATDVAARGLDIEGLDLVINYQLARESEVHIHRIGRTGRAGKAGQAITLAENKEQFKIERLERVLGHPIALTALTITAQGNLPNLNPTMVTLAIDGGKKQKLRAGDILGALTANKALQASEVGKINIFDFCAYVAVTRDKAKTALNLLNEGKLKGRSFRARRVKV